MRLLLLQRFGLCPSGPEGLRLLADDRQGRRALRRCRRRRGLGPDDARELLVRRRGLLRVRISLRAHAGEAAEGEGGADEPEEIGWGGGAAANRGGGVSSEVKRARLAALFLKQLVN